MDPLGKTHTIVALTNLSGPGAGANDLPMTYDMSLFEWSWGGRQSTFNGAGITTNRNFPLVDGAAITTNTDVGVEMISPGGWVAGIQGEAYALAGNRTVGRVFGEELPWDNFDRVDGSPVPARFNLDLDRGWLRYNRNPWSVQLIGGTLPPQTLPEFTQKPMNSLRLGSLIWRQPIVNADYFTKEDRKLEEGGRHPVRGGNLLLDYEYPDKRHLHLELFSGQTKPTPLASIDRLSWGGRLGADFLRGNAGLTFIRADGDKPRSERENQWALDASYPLLSWASAFGAWVRSSYTRTSVNLDGTAAVGGLLFKNPAKRELKIQYQWVGENYDLIGTHKTEHYPSNFRGINAEATLSMGRATFKGILYHLQQMEINTRTGDTIFGDSYFPALANSKPGSITMWRMGAESKPLERLKIKGYLEQAIFRKDADPDTDDIDKRVLNLTVGPGIGITPNLQLDLGLRHLLATGRWQAMRFHHRQTVPNWG